jgi:hypothetical protein
VSDSFDVRRFVAFMEHFQDVARGHFTVRRLERLYGKETIRAAYEVITTRERIAS